MNGLFYLAHLVQTKNNLNRKRRRFWNLAFTRQRFSTFSASWIEVKLPKAFTYKMAEQGYKLAKVEMKDMTKHMRATREEIDARFEWTCGSAISAILLDGKRYSEKEIAKLAECYLADKILLGDK